MKSANANTKGSEESKDIFGLDNVAGSVQITKDLSLLPFENVTISGLMKGPVKCSAYFKRVNVAIEPLGQHNEGEGPYCAVPAYTYLKFGLNSIEVMLKNITAHKITIKSGDKVAKIEPANAVPPMLAPKPQEGVTPVVGKSAEVDLEAGIQGSSLKQQP